MLKERHARYPARLSNLSASVPCTCGELFQGSLQGETCLVSCPIDIYSTAYLLPPGDQRTPAGKKVQLALSKANTDLKDHIALSIIDELPPGRGFGTSTADIGAALYALSAQSGIDLSHEEAARIAVSVEPSDSTLFPGLALFAHKSGAFYRPLGETPAVKILILDPGGYVDTEEFNARDWSYQLGKLASDHKRAFELLENGIKQNNLAMLGRAATLSARLHQEILFNPLLEKTFKVAAHIHAVGVCRAHSGTILGFLLEPERDDDEHLLEFCRRHFPSGVRFRMTSLVNGGVRLSTQSQFSSKGVQK